MSATPKCRARKTMGKPIGQHGKEDQGQHIAGEHVGVKTDGERHDAREVRDDLNREHQRRDPPDRPHEVLDVSDEALGRGPIVVVVEKCEQRDAERHDRVGGGRSDAREQAEAVAGHDEEQDGSYEREMRLVAVADDGLALAETNPLIISASCWIDAGLLNAQRRRTATKKRKQQRGHDQLRGSGWW